MELVKMQNVSKGESLQDQEKDSLIAAWTQVSTCLNQL